MTTVHSCSCFSSKHLLAAMLRLLSAAVSNTCLSALLYWLMSGCARAGYSVWTNSSFKAPLISSAVACILGNALYCIGYDTKWLSILMAARLLTGLGKAPSLFPSHCRLLHVQEATCMHDIKYVERCLVLCLFVHVGVDFMVISMCFLCLATLGWLY